MPHILSRKSFLALGLAPIAKSLAQDRQITARQVIERIQQNVGVPWRAQTVDTFKAGNPDAPIKGIATTMMATLDLLQRAAKAGRNLVITHEPTWFNHEDNFQTFANDKVLEAKQDFIAKNNLVIWRFHDHWHMRKPDGIMTGMAKALAWDKHKGPEDGLYDLPKTTLGALASEMQSRLKIRVLRVVGDPALPVRRASISPGYAMLQGVMRHANRPEVDVVVVGETREWEGVEYIQDMVAAGQKKGLIILGHVLSEEAGMRECAEWLRTFVTEVPVDFISAGEPYWAPGRK